MGLYHPLDANTNLKYKLLGFLTPNKKNSNRKALAFNRDRCCHLALCLLLILLHCGHLWWRHRKTVRSRAGHNSDPRYECLDIGDSWRWLSPRCLLLSNFRLLPRGQPWKLLSLSRHIVTLFRVSTEILGLYSQDFIFFRTYEWAQ